MMEMASFTGIIKTLFYIVLFYYAFKFLMRIFAPILMRKAMNKMQEKMAQQMHQQQNYNQSTSTEPTKKAMPNEKAKIGEYIDFEEVD
jgi:flagellar biosynthesis/type III secretory pathway M-ring protein FliF/YscJ